MLPLDITVGPCDSPTMSKPAQHELDINRPDWHTDAACRDQPLELWFPDWSLFERSKPRPSTPTDAWSWSPHAAAVCLTCPSQDPCLDYALRRNVDGIWSNTTPPERRDIRRRRGLALIDDHDPTHQPEPGHDGAAA